MTKYNNGLEGEITPDEMDNLMDLSDEISVQDNDDAQYVSLGIEGENEIATPIDIDEEAEKQRQRDKSSEEMPTVDIDFDDEGYGQPETVVLDTGSVELNDEPPRSIQNMVGLDDIPVEQMESTVNGPQYEE